jgi:NADPH2:quinone reductase
VGKDTFLKGLDAIRPRGLMVLWGQASGAVDPFNPSVLNAKGSLFLTRPKLQDYIATREDLLWRAGDVLRWLDSGEVQLRVEKTYPLADAAQAHRDIESRKTAGKLVLLP